MSINKYSLTNVSKGELDGYQLNLKAFNIIAQNSLVGPNGPIEPVGPNDINRSLVDPINDKLNIFGLSKNTAPNNSTILVNDNHISISGYNNELPSSSDNILIENIPINNDAGMTLSKLSFDNSGVDLLVSEKATPTRNSSVEYDFNRIRSRISDLTGVITEEQLSDKFYNVHVPNANSNLSSASLSINGTTPFSSEIDLSVSGGLSDKESHITVNDDDVDIQCKDLAGSSSHLYITTNAIQSDVVGPSSSSQINITDTNITISADTDLVLSRTSGFPASFSIGSNPVASFVLSGVMPIANANGGCLGLNGDRIIRTSAPDLKVVDRNRNPITTTGVLSTITLPNLVPYGVIPNSSPHLSFQTFGFIGKSTPTTANSVITVKFQFCQTSPTIANPITIASFDVPVSDWSDPYFMLNTDIYTVGYDSIVTKSHIVYKSGTKFTSSQLICKTETDLGLSLFQLDIPTLPNIYYIETALGADTTAINYATSCYLTVPAP